jgi:hypothetical protein
MHTQHHARGCPVTKR